MFPGVCYVVLFLGASPFSLVSLLNMLVGGLEVCEVGQRALNLPNLIVLQNPQDFVIAQPR